MAEPQAETVKATKREKVLVDVRVEADLERGLSYSRYYTDRAKRIDAHAKELDSLVDDFNKFIRDHRSMDFVRLNVERQYQDQCSSCLNEWETHVEEGVTYCSHCGTEVA